MKTQKKEQKSEKNTRLEARRRTNASRLILLLGSILALFLIPSVTAFDFDNVQRMNGTSKVSIVNAYGLGSTLAEYTLKENTNYCLIDCYAEGSVWMNTESKLLTSIKFISSANTEKSISYNIFIYTFENQSYDEDVFKNVCELNKTTGKDDCVSVKTGTEKKTKEIGYWKPYNGEVLAKGIYKWRIEGKKRLGENIDWQITTMGQTLDKWAWWSGGTDWTKRKDVTVKGGQSDLANFTVYLNVTFDGDMQADFDDLRFINGSCSGPQDLELVYEMPFKIDSNKADVWLRLPNLVAGNNSVCMYYGNSGAAKGSNPPEAWDPSYTAIYHLDSNESSKVFDSRGRYNATMINQVYQNTSCVFGSCYTFAGGYIHILNSFSGIPEATMEAFGYLYTYAGDNHALWGNTHKLSFETFVTQDAPDLRSLVWDATPTLKNAQYAGTWGTYKWNYGGTSVNGNVVTYVNQSWFVGDAFASSISSSPGSNTSIGGTIATGGTALLYPWAGSIDEVRFSNVTRSQAWMNRSYNNKDYSLFYFGEEQISNTLSVSLNTPDTNQKFNVSSVTFNCSANDDTEVVNLTLIINDTPVYTQVGTGSANLSLQRAYSLGDGTHNYTCRASDGTSTQSASAKTFTIDTTAPVLNLITPLVNRSTTKLPFNVSINYTVTDANTESCYLRTNENMTMVAVTCGVTYNISFKSGGWKQINYSANDTHGNSATANGIFFINSINTTYWYRPQVVEGETNEFYFNITANQLTRSSVNLTYDGTTYPMTLIASNTTYATYYKSLSVPSVTANTDKSLSFNYSVNGENYTVASLTQTVFKLTNISIGESCAAGLNATINITYADEKNLTRINATTEYTFTFGTTNGSYHTISGTVTNVPGILVCYNASVNVSTWNIGVGMMYTYTGGYTPRYNYVLNTSLSVTKVTLPLVLLETAVGTSFILKVQDNSLSPIEGAYIYVQRYYPSTNSWITTEMGLTDQNGKSAAFFETNSALYRFIIVKDGTIIYQSVTTGQKISPEEAPYTLTFTTGSYQTPIDLGNIQYLTSNITFNWSSKVITYNYIDLSPAFTRARLEVTVINRTREIVFCNTTSAVSSGALTCSVATINGTFIARGYVSRGGIEIFDKQITDVSTRGINPYGGSGLFVFFLLLLVSGFIFVYSPTASIICINVIVIGAELINIISFGMVFIFGMIAVSIFLINELNS